MYFFSICFHSSRMLYFVRKFLITPCGQQIKNLSNISRLVIPLFFSYNQKLSVPVLASLFSLFSKYPNKIFWKILVFPKSLLSIVYICLFSNIISLTSESHNKAFRLSPVSLNQISSCNIHHFHHDGFLQ